MALLGSIYVQFTLAQQQSLAQQQTVVQITPSEEESRKLAGYLDQPGRVLADLSTPEQFMHVIGQVITPLHTCLAACSVL